MSAPSDHEHLELERQKVALLRTKAEPDDAQPNKDDYIFIDGKYRVVRFTMQNLVFNQSPLPPSPTTKPDLPLCRFSPIITISCLESGKEFTTKTS